MKSPTTLLLSASVVLSAMVVGCVPYQTYEELKFDYEKARKAHADLSAKYNRVLAGLGRGAGDDNLGEGEVGRLEALLRNKEDEVRLLQTKLDELERTPAIKFPDDIVRQVPGASIGSSGQLVLGEAILFNPGSSSLKTAGRATLDQLAHVLKAQFANETFNLVGHTDNVPLNKTKQLYEFNHKLGFERAYTVFKYLIMEHGIPEAQFRLHTYGSTDPTDPSMENTAEGRARNRRVEIYRSGSRF